MRNHKNVCYTLLRFYFYFKSRARDCCLVNNALPRPRSTAETSMLLVNPPSLPHIPFCLVSFPSSPTLLSFPPTFPGRMAQRLPHGQFVPLPNLCIHLYPKYNTNTRSVLARESVTFWHGPTKDPLAKFMRGPDAPNLPYGYAELHVTEAVHTVTKATVNSTKVQ